MRLPLKQGSELRQAIADALDIPTRPSCGLFDQSATKPMNEDPRIAKVFDRVCAMGEDADPDLVAMLLAPLLGPGGQELAESLVRQIFQVNDLL